MSNQGEGKNIYFVVERYWERDDWACPARRKVINIAEDKSEAIGMMNMIKAKEPNRTIEVYESSSVYRVKSEVTKETV